MRRSTLSAMAGLLFALPLFALLLAFPLNAAMADVLVTVDKDSQRMTVWVDGVEEYSWPVSTGTAGYDTPSGTYTPTSMNEIWYSKQWDNAPMPHSIFFTKKGHAIHGSNETKRLGTAASHGCVRLAPENAAILYALVDEQGLENTQVVVSGTSQQMANAKPDKQRKPKGMQTWPDNYYGEAYAPPRGWRKKGRGWAGGSPAPWFQAPPRRRWFQGPY